MNKEVIRKLGIKADARIILIGAPDAFGSLLNDGNYDIQQRLSGTFNFIHFFAKNISGLDKKFPSLKRHLAEKGNLWVSWPKNKSLGTDLTIKSVIKTGYDHGLVESKTISIDETWSAIKFTHPKQGKIYNNSYGKLPGGNEG